MRTGFSHEGKHYTIPAPVDYRGYQLKDVTLVAQAEASAGGDMAAHRKRSYIGLHSQDGLQDHDPSIWRKSNGHVNATVPGDSRSARKRTGAGGGHYSRVRFLPVQRPR